MPIQPSSPELGHPDRPHAAMTAERLRTYIEACLWRHADIESARDATSVHMDRLAILAVDSDGLTWRVWISAQPRDDA
jgi:hypothetical protein